MEKNKEYVGTVCAIGSNGEGIINEVGGIKDAVKKLRSMI